MPTRTVRILFVEYPADDAALIAARLAQEGWAAAYDMTLTGADLAAALRGKTYDVILCGGEIADPDAHDAMERIRVHAPHIPLIAVADSLDAERAIALMRGGARDVVLKSDLDRLAAAIEWEIASHAQRVTRGVEMDQNERHFANLVERSLQGIIIRGQFKTLFVNETMCRMFGYTDAEMADVGTVLELIHPDDRDRISKHIVRQLHGDDRAQRVETRALRKDGTTFWVETIASNIVWLGEEAVQIVATDITERKEAEQARAESERQYRETFEAAPVAMSWISKKGRYIRTNRAFQDLFGYSAAELAGMSPADTMHPKYLDDSRRRIADLVSGASDRALFETLHLHRDGSPIWLWINVAVMRDANGAPDYLLSHLQDITARKSAEDQLFQAQKMEAIGNFAGGIAHDFNNMLVPIIGMAEMTKEDLPPGSPLRDNLDLVLAAAEKAKGLVQQILTFSRQDEAAIAAINLSICVGEALNLLRSVLPSTIKLTETIQPNVGTVMADSAQVQSIIMNLGSNAAAAIGANIGEVKIDLSRIRVGADRTAIVLGLSNGGIYAKLSVADTGSGMDNETLAKIFNPFFTTKAPGAGTGLGLAMVHGIVERYGGVIDVASKVGIGTTFDIYLPVVDRK